MIQCVTLVAVGWVMFYDGIYSGDKWLAIIGIALYIFGTICGEIIETRMIDRIEKLEKGNKNEETNS